jgi:hypothetical protein
LAGMYLQYSVGAASLTHELCTDSQNERTWYQAMKKTNGEVKE